MLLLVFYYTTHIQMFVTTDPKLYCSIVSKGGHTPPLFLIKHHFSKIPPFLGIRDVPTFHRFIGKTKVLGNSCNQFVYNFYPQSILVLEECLKKW